MHIHTYTHACIERERAARDIEEKLRDVNICLIGIAQTRGKKGKAIFEKLVAEIFPALKSYVLMLNTYSNY